MQRGFIEPGEKPRRFYKDVTVTEAEGGFGVALDNRALRTPGGHVLALPTRALAEMVAEEWRGQGEFILQADMHATRLANTAQESVPPAHDAVAASVARYAASDTLCYFADAPEALVERQDAQWAPVLERAERELGLAFTRASGITHQDQPPATLERVTAIAAGLDDFRLAGLAFGAALFSSAVLALGVLRGWFSGEAAFDLARLDEAFQEDQWGVDAEAAERTDRLRVEARVLDQWFRALA